MYQFNGYLGKRQNNSQFKINIPLKNGMSFCFNYSENCLLSENKNGLIVSTEKSIYLDQLSGQDALDKILLESTNCGFNNLDATLSKIKGHYSLLIFEKSSQQLTVITDKLGTHPVYYCQLNDEFYFSSSLKKLKSLAPIEFEISPQAIYQYIYFHCIPAPNTIYHQARKLMAAEKLIFSNKLQLHTYYIPNFEFPHLEPAVLQSKLLHSLESAVQRSIETSDQSSIGAFLSGGLDSSTVAGFLAKHSVSKQAKTFTIGFNAEGYDESEFAKITADHFNTDHHVYYVTPENIQEALSEISIFYDEPFGNSSALPAYYCAKFAKENGIDTLLAGDGGDELFAGNERYAKQKVFEIYYKIPSILRKTLLEMPLSLISEESSIPLISKAASYVRQAKTKLPERLQTYNFLNRFNPRDVFSSDLVDQVDLNLPNKLMRSRYFEPKNADTLSRMLYLDWKFTLADNDLVKVSNMCHLAGVDVKYPMLDDELLTLATQVPSELKLPGQELRKFYKDACKGFLADATLNKSKKGFGLPFGVWIREHHHLKELAYSNVRALKETGFFKDEFLEHAIHMHSSDHPGYYGELIWILMMLNLWLKSH